MQDSIEIQPKFRTYCIIDFEIEMENTYTKAELVAHSGKFGIEFPSKTTVADLREIFRANKKQNGDFT